MGMILRIASSRIVGQGDIVGRSGYFSLNLSANSVMRGRLDARRTLKSLVADLRYNIILSIMRRQVYKKVIEIAPDLKRQIAMEMGCTVDTVYNALNLSNPTTGAQPDRIRRRAMELGGKENRKIRWINY